MKIEGEGMGTDISIADNEGDKQIQFNKLHFSCQAPDGLSNTKNYGGMIVYSKGTFPAMAQLGRNIQPG